MASDAAGPIDQRVAGKGLTMTKAARTHRVSHPPGSGPMRDELYARAPSGLPRRPGPVKAKSEQHTNAHDCGLTTLLSGGCVL
jgi:hypothetical protein